MSSPCWTSILRPIDGSGRSEAIVRQLGELIGSGQLAPGTQFPPETVLAEYLDVSPMTVRNAFQVMRSYGLVETRRGREAGTVVRADAAVRLQHKNGSFPTLEEFSDLTVWREAVSGEACARAAERISEVQAEELCRLERLTAAEGQDPATYRLADANLHMYIAEIADSSRLVEAEQKIQSYLTRTLADEHFRPDSKRLKSQGHGPLIEAIISGDVTASRRRLHEHARATVDVLVGIGRLKEDAVKG